MIWQIVYLITILLYSKIEFWTILLLSNAWKMETGFVKRYEDLQKKLKLTTRYFKYVDIFSWSLDIKGKLNEEKTILFELVSRQVNIIKLFIFFTRLGLSNFLIYRIFYYNFYSKWVYLNYKFNATQYRKFMVDLLTNYYLLFHDAEVVNRNKIILFPSNFLLNYTIKCTSELRLSYRKLGTYKFWYKAISKKEHKKNSYRQLNISFLGEVKELSNFDNLNYSNNLMLLNFLRVQRRYNKRRYSKVRAYSRPSFFAGISLCNLFLAGFWGGTYKGVDWQSTFLVNVDINFVLLAILLYLINKIIRFSYWSNFLAIWSRAKFSYSIDKMLNLHLLRRLRW